MEPSLRVAILLVFAFVFAVNAAPTDLEKRDANSNADAGWGWSTFTVADGSRKINIPVRGKSAQLAALIDQKYDANRITRVVIQVHGHGRDANNYYSHTVAARSQAQKKLGVDPATVLVVAPEYFSIGDHTKGAIPRGNPDNQLCWEGDWWAGGHDSLCPQGGKGISSFEATDKLVDWLTDGKFPNLKVITLAGHSLGGHFVQRYANLGKPVTRGKEMHYWVGNPASYLYYDKARPVSRKKLQGCKHYNKFMYGNSGASEVFHGYDIGSKKQWYDTYSSRLVHISIGTQDYGTGVLGCEGKVQGKSHWERSTGFVQYLNELVGGYPALHTVDYLTASHDARAMLTKKITLQRLFTDYYSSGKVTASRTPNGLTNGAHYTFINSDGSAATRVKL